MVIFVSAPIIAQSDFNKEEILEVVKELESFGNTVFHPIMIIPVHHPELITDYQYMEMRMSMLRAADTVYFTNNWDKSRACKLEHDFAKSSKKKVVYLKTGITLAMGIAEIQKAYADGTDMKVLAGLNNCKIQTIIEICNGIKRKNGGIKK